MLGVVYSVICLIGLDVGWCVVGDSVQHPQGLGVGCWVMRIGWGIWCLVMGIGCLVLCVGNWVFDVWCWVSAVWCWVLGYLV